MPRTPEPTPEIPGYTLQGLLGVGTSGRVYRGLKTATGEPVAVKVLEGALDPRFAREVAILRVLEHPHILKILDHGSIGGRAFLVTERVTGTTLSDLLPLRVLGPAALARTLAKLAEAIGEAHAAGVLHRDVKPANVLLDADMEPRLVDFGLATFAQDMGTLTRSGTSVGTPMYMAPEVLKWGSKYTTEKADVYALGVILFEGLTTRHPFQGPDWPTTRERILEGAVPPIPQASSRLRGACLAALNRDRAARPTARALAQALFACSETLGKGAPSSPRPAAPLSFGRGAAAERAVGSRIGPYVLEELLGEGGMGAVFLGRHEQTNAHHAVKIVKAGGPIRRKRLEVEALALAKVDRHPGIVGIHLFEVLDSGDDFFALDYVPGTDLERELKAGPLTIDRAVRIARQVAEALAHVHARGIVHRDVKPANILLNADDDRALLTDFGLALDAEEQRLTASNAIMGTPCFMAPEQASGSRGEVGPKADVFSLGAVLYAMLVGKAPFSRPHFVALLEALLTVDPVSPRRERPEISPALEEVIFWALEKDPADRPSARDLAEALAALQRGEGFARREGAQARVRRLARRVGGPRLALVVALGLTALGGGGLTLALTARSERRASWEAKARVAIDAAEPALERANQRALTAFFDWESGAPPPPSDWRELEALERVASRGDGVGSELIAAVSQLAAASRDVRRRAEVEVALGAGDLDGAGELLSELSLPGQTVFGALIRVRRGEQVEPSQLLVGVERLPEWAADRLRLLAARVELDREDRGAARALLASVSARHHDAVNPLLAEVCVREALVAAKAADARGLRRGLLAAAALDAKLGEAGAARAAALAVRSWESGAKAATLTPLLDVLNRLGRATAAAAPIYVAAAVDASRSGAAEAGLVSARALEHALRLNPDVAFPEELLVWLSFQAGVSLGRGDVRGALQTYRACTRGGMVIGSSNVGSTRLIKIYRSGLFDEWVRADPDDWVSVAWRGLGAYATQRGGEILRGAEQLELARAAYEDFQRCLEHPEVQGKLRAELELQQLKCSTVFEGDALDARIQELDARGDFPELWRVFRIGVDSYRGGDPEQELRYARRFVEELIRRLKATADGRLGPAETGADLGSLDGAYAALVRSLIACRRFDEARALLKKRSVRANLNREDVEQFERMLGAR